MCPACLNYVNFVFSLSFCSTNDGPLGPHWLRTYFVCYYSHMFMDLVSNTNKYFTITETIDFLALNIFIIKCKEEKFVPVFSKVLLSLLLDQLCTSVISKSKRKFSYIFNIGYITSNKSK